MLKINSNTQLILTSMCIEGCEEISKLSYSYNIYKYWQITTVYNEEKWIKHDNTSDLRGFYLIN